MKGKITISRPHGGDEERIEIEVVDSMSRVEFLEVKMSLADFTRALTGQGSIPCEFNVRRLDLVGKMLETKTVEFKIPDSLAWEKDDDTLNRLAIAECRKIDGSDDEKNKWTPDTYYRSQNSFFNKDGQYYARTIARRYI